MANRHKAFEKTLEIAKIATTIIREMTSQWRHIDAIASRAIAMFYNELLLWEV